MPGSGTDKTKDWLVRPGPSVGLVEPQLGETIGAAARGMALCGLQAKMRKENDMAAVRYIKADWVAEADIQARADGKYQGVVLVQRQSGDADGAQHTVEGVSDSPAEALDEAKALAHRILSDL